MILVRWGIRSESAILAHFKSSGDILIHAVGAAPEK